MTYLRSDGTLWICLRGLEAHSMMNGLFEAYGVSVVGNGLVFLSFGVL